MKIFIEKLLFYMKIIKFRDSDLKAVQVKPRKSSPVLQSPVQSCGLNGQSALQIAGEERGG